MGTRALGFGAIAIALLLAAPPMSAAADAAAWAALRASGAVVVVRHSYAPGAFDPPGARLDDCSTQRNLDDNGRAQARRIGEAFRREGIAVGAVLSSPRCRCLDTARLAFGKVEAWDALQGSLRDPERRQAHQSSVSRFQFRSAHRLTAAPGRSGLSAFARRFRARGPCFRGREPFCRTPRGGRGAEGIRLGSRLKLLRERVFPARLSPRPAESGSGSFMPADGYPGASRSCAREAQQRAPALPRLKNASRSAPSMDRVIGI